MSLNKIDRLRLETDFKYFCSWSGPDPFTNNQILVTKQHLDLIFMLMSQRDTTVVAYRGFGKSTLVTYKYALRRAIMHQKTVCIFSANEDLAIDKLKIIKTALESFPQLDRYCGKGYYTWNDKEIWLIDKEHGIKTKDNRELYPVIAKIKALGFNSKIRGSHYDIVIPDDIVIEENTLTPKGEPDQDKITKLKRDFYGKVVPIKNPGGAIILVGTPQFRDAEHPKESDLLYEWIKKKNKNSFVLPAYNETGDPTCPGLHTKEFLEDMKASIDEAAWAKEYMLNPKAVKSTMLSEELLNKCKDIKHTYTVDYIPSPKEVVILGTDYTYLGDKQKAEKNDTAYFALIAVAYNQRTGMRKIININYERGITFSDQINKTKRWVQEYGVTVVALELHGGLLLFKSELEKIIPPHVQLIDASNHGNKFDTLTGLPSVEYLFTKQLITLAYKDADDIKKSDWLLHELKYLKSAGHVDVLDALLRVDTVIKKYYGKFTHKKNFSIIKMQQGQKPKLTEMEMEKLSVFGRPSKKRIEQAQEEKLMRQKIKGMGQQNIDIVLSRLV